MSDPLSIISAIVGILAAAGKVVEVLGPYVSAAKDTPKIARSVHSEVVNSRIILSALHGLLDDLGTASRNRTLLVPIDDLITVFTNGVLIFSELEELVSRISLPGADRLKTRMQWARKEDDFSAILLRLQAFKDTTLLLLNILQCDSDRRAAKTQDELSKKLLKLLQKTNISQRLGTLEDSFDALSLVEPRRANRTQSSVLPSFHHQPDSDLDNQSFYSSRTPKPMPNSQTPAPLQKCNETSFAVPTLEFQAALDESAPYRRARVGTIDVSAKNSVAASNTWSVFSGVSLSEISILSRVAIPVFPTDISNSHHYEFMKSTAIKLYTARRPTEATMGKWAQSVKRVPLLKELRFEIQFEVPVIFITQPGNFLGLLSGEPVMFIDGSDRSLDQTWTEILPHPRSLDTFTGLPTKHNPNNQLATWVTLLSALQTMESRSREWQRHTFEVSQSHYGSSVGVEKLDVDQTMLDVSKSHTLAIALQLEAKTWTRLPPNFKQPYATTVWCHIIELTALLGIYWKDFNRSRDIYRAHGNGFNVTSTTVTNLGTVFNFHIDGANRFDERRVIPVIEIKELCFGRVATIFRTHDWTPSKFRESSVDQPTPETMRLADTDEIAHTLATFGCNNFTIKFFLQGKVVSHIFPVVFEIIGMVAKSMHIRSSAFRMLPNPTQYRWEPASFSVGLMMKSFLNCLAPRMQDAANEHISLVRRNILKNSSAIFQRMGQVIDRGFDVKLINLLHQSIADATEVLTACQVSTRLNSLNESEKEHGAVIASRKKLVLLTLRSHIQVVLTGLNGVPESGAHLDGGTTPDSGEALKWSELDQVPPELKQEKLMEIYFHAVLPKVVADVEKLAHDLDVSLSVQDFGHDGVIDYFVRGNAEYEVHIPLWKLQYVSCEDVWYTLVFRSICWLMLHDFHPDDVQIPKSDMYGSLMPVYIA